MVRKRLTLLAFFLCTSPAFAQFNNGRNVVFVDNAQPGGAGTPDRPFATIGEAVAKAGASDIVFVAKGSKPYDETVTLKPGQLLVGAAFGLTAVVSEFHIEVAAPPTPPTEPPSIHGIVSNGNNLIAGVRIDADSGTAFSVIAPAAQVTVRNVVIAPSKTATAISIVNASAPVVFTGGGIIASGSARALVVDGDSSEVIFDQFPIAGVFGTAIALRNCSSVVFRNEVTINDAQTGIAAANCKASFAVPVTMHAHGNAIELHGAALDAKFVGLTAPSIVIDKLTGGRIAIDGGTFRGGTVQLSDLSAPVVFTGVKFADALLAIDQRANSGTFTCDRCDLSADAQPMALPFLARIRTGGSGALAATFTALQLHDNMASGLSATATETSTLTLTLANPTAQHLGGSVVELTAAPTTHARLSLHDAHAVLPGSSGKPLVLIDAPSGCADLANNQLVFGGGAPEVKSNAPLCK